MKSVSFYNLQSFSYGAGLVALAAAVVAAAAPASAETPEAASAGGASVDEVIVTARRRAENPQSVPIPLSVFSGAQLDRQNVYGLDQLQRQTPSLQVIGNNPRNTNINIRGLGSNLGLTNDGLDNGVGVYIDDVYYARQGQALFDLLDIDRIEVLRGPQGTLFGKNTTAGAISIYTRGPSFTPEFDGSASVGEHGYHQLSAAAGGPIVADKLAGRLTIAETAHDGFLSDVTDGRRLNGFNDFTLRGQLLANLTDTLTLHLNADYGDQHEAGYASSVLGYVTEASVNGAAPTPLSNAFAARYARFGLSPLPVDPFSRQVALDGPTLVSMQQGGTSGKVDWRLPGATLTSITAYRFWHWKPRNDADSTPLPILTQAYAQTRQHQFSQEIRLASDGYRKLDYVVGAYYFTEELNTTALTSYGSAAPLFLSPAGTTAATVSPAFQGLDGFNVLGLSHLVEESYAGFAQATWHLNSRLSLTGGLRYTDEKKTGSFQQTNYGGELTAVTNAYGPATAYTASTHEGQLSGQANASFKLTRDALIFATYARGFKSGGLSLTNLPAGVPYVIAPEQVDDYELGLKSQWLDRRLTFNATAFWTRDNNYQATIYDPVKTTTYVTNVGDVQSRGLEFESNFRPVEGLTGYLSATVLDAKYLSFDQAALPIGELGSTPAYYNASGRVLPGAPKFTGAAGGEYEFPIRDQTKGYVGFDYTYRSSIYYSTNDDPASRIKGYGLVNARVGARLKGDRIDISLWARNLFDKDYLVTKQPGAFNTGIITGVIGDPRIIGATLRVHY